MLGADGSHHESGDPEVLGRTVTQAVDQLEPGQVDVSYRIVSADGHPVTGTIRFTVAPQATAEPTIEPTVPRAEPSAVGQSVAASMEATAVASGDGNGSGTPMPVLVAVGGIAAALTIVGTYLAMGGRRAGGTVAGQAQNQEEA